MYINKKEEKKNDILVIYGFHVKYVPRRNVMVSAPPSLLTSIHPPPFRRCIQQQICTFSFCHCLCVCCVALPTSKHAQRRTAGYASTACSASLPVNKPKMQTQLHDASSINTKTAANGGTRGSTKIYNNKKCWETKQIVKYIYMYMNEICKICLVHALRLGQ